MVVVSILANGAIVKSFVLLDLHYMAAQLFATAIVLGLNFFICKLWIFTKNT